MLGQYLPIIALAVLAVIFAALSILASRLLAPRRRTVVKEAPYECGVDLVDTSSQRHTVRFFLVAMLFIVFDVEIIFLYPWAVSNGELGLFGLVAVLIFSFAVFESFLYLISNGALNWGPSRKMAAQQMAAGRGMQQPSAATGAVSPQRTAATTVRRVGSAVQAR